MLISVVVPAFAAQKTIANAVCSMLAQTWSNWEAIIVSDDATDYAEFLASRHFADDRLRFASTQAFRSGCHNARNVGLGLARGDLICSLDADDAFYPSRLAALAPIANEHGAAADNLAVVSEDGTVLYRVIGESEGLSWLSTRDFFELTAPLFPLVRRELARPRLPGIEHADDVVANLQLIDQIGALPVVPETLMEYRVVAGSLCHGSGSALAFEHAYSNLLERLEDANDGLGIKQETRTAARRGLAAKRALNRAFHIAEQSDGKLNFQAFISRSGMPRHRTHSIALAEEHVLNTVNDIGRGCWERS